MSQYFPFYRGGLNVEVALNHSPVSLPDKTFRHNITQNHKATKVIFQFPSDSFFVRDM